MSGEPLKALEPLFDSLQDGVCVADRGGRVLYANAAATQILGLTADELRGSSLCGLLCGSLDGPCAPDASACPLRSAGDRREAVTFAGRDRRTKRELRVRCLRARSGAEERHFLHIEDASSEAEAERRREEWRQMLVHDLRVPLTITLGVLRELEDRGSGYQLSEQDREMLGIGARACKRMQSLIDSYLEAARLEAGAMPLHPARIDAGRLLFDCVAEQAEQARERGIELSASAPAGLDARGDPELLRRSVMNLIGNALKFTPRGGRVRAVGEQSKGFVLLRVIDNGPGIPEDDLPRIFERFFQGRDDKHAGLGLGLTFCRAALRAMGGEICVESALGKGSAFTLRVPAAGGEP